ncbi:MAG: hypothetical protein VYB46_02350 [Pseudomonadota bacterium]|nr:hypothetical protein [Pseudomonadota bacterium]
MNRLLPPATKSFSVPAVRKPLDLSDTQQVLAALDHAGNTSCTMNFAKQNTPGSKRCGDQTDTLQRFLQRLAPEEFRGQTCVRGC